MRLRASSQTPAPGTRRTSTEAPWGRLRSCPYKSSCGGLTRQVRCPASTAVAKRTTAAGAATTPFTVLLRRLAADRRRGLGQAPECAHRGNPPVRCPHPATAPGRPTYATAGNPLPSAEHPIVGALRTGEARTGYVCGVDRGDGGRAWLSAAWSCSTPTTARTPRSWSRSPPAPRYGHSRCATSTR